MPRKSIPRAFKLLCKHYRGFDRQITFKALATRKFHASQGVFVNHKLAAAPDCKYSKNHSIVRSYALHYPSFAAQSTASRVTSQLPHHLHSHPASSQLGPAAPSFAANPVWQPQHTEASHSLEEPALTDMADTAPQAPPRESQLKCDPMYQFATLNQPTPSVGKASRQSKMSREKDALRWYGRLDSKPIAKVSAATCQHSKQTDPSRLAAAFAAYADLDGPKH